MNVEENGLWDLENKVRINLLKKLARDGREILLARGMREEIQMCHGFSAFVFDD
jgi:hypothetical protein